MPTILHFFTIIFTVLSISNCASNTGIIHTVNDLEKKPVTNNLEIDWSGCGESKGCFRSPSGCDPQSCDVIISWQDMDGTVHFELSQALGTASTTAHWIAVGFSPTASMLSASVISCIQATDGTFKVESSYNSDVIKSNTVLENDLLGIVDGSYRGQVNNGRSECEFSRVKEVKDDPEANRVFNLSSPSEYHFLLAHGATSETGSKRKHTESPIITATRIDVGKYEDIHDTKFDWDSCGLTKGCFRSPSVCDQQTCNVRISWQERGDMVHFEMSRALGSTPSEEHWIALGVSPDTSMGDTSVTACIHTSDGMKAIESSFNGRRSNNPLQNSTLGIVDDLYRGWVRDGRSDCEFTRLKAVTPDDPESHLVYNLTSPLQYYYILAHGGIREGGLKAKHVEAPIDTAKMIDIGVYEDIGKDPDQIPTVTPPEFEFRWNDCGITKGCYRSPTYCDPEDCHVIASWEDREDTVHFELSRRHGSSPSDAHWIAVGISSNMFMTDSSVVSCIHTGNGGFRMESSFNDGYSNEPLTDTNLGIVDGSYRAQVRDGKSECEFSRLKAVSPDEEQADRVFNLTSPLQYHYLFAHGSVTESGSKSWHSEPPTVTSMQIDAGIYENIGGNLFTWSTCGHTKGCYRFPSGCEPQDCDVLVSWEDRDETVHFEMSTLLGSTSSQSHWTALGISETPSMFNASVIACLHLDDGNVRPESSFNDALRYSNTILENDTLGIIEDSFRGLVSNGRSECEFSRIKAVSSDFLEAPLVFNISSPLQYHYLLAQGEMLDGKKRRHQQSPVVTETKIDVGVFENIGQNPNDNSTIPPPDFEFNWNDCGVTKGCFRSPAKCEPENCEVLISWKENEEDVHFELSTLTGSVPSSGSWIAVGFSETTNMDATSVISCIQQSDGRSRPESSYNSQRVNLPLIDDALGIIDGSYQGGVKSGRSDCEFRRIKALPPGTPEGEFVFDISPPLTYHFLLAHGSLSPSGTKSKHEVSPVITPTKLSVGENVNIGGAFVNPLIQAHATLMLAAWTLFSGVGILNARYFKKAWPSIEVAGLKLWFVIHRVCMTLVMALTMAGFVNIFVHVQGFTDVNSITPGVIRSHPFIGIIVMACVLINPIMAMFRPNPTAPKRPIFNWAHRIVGEGGRICAVFNLMTGLSLSASQAIVEDWMFWAMIGAICFHIVIEMILLVRHILKGKQLRRIDTMNMELYGMDENKPETNTSSVLETTLLIIYSVCVASLTLAILIRIAIV